MASIYDLKPKFQTMLRPLCAQLAKAGVTANQVTLAAFVLSIVFGAAMLLSGGDRLVLVFLAPVLFVRMAMNAIDGMLAREFNQKSSLGAILNEVTDVLSDAALYLPFALLPGIDPALIVVIVVFSISSEMMGVIAVQIGASRRYDGPFGKSDRAFFFGALSLLIAFGLTPGLWSTVLLAAAAAASVATIVNRARSALNEAGDD